MMSRALAHGRLAILAGALTIATALAVFDAAAQQAAPNAPAASQPAAPIPSAPATPAPATTPAAPSPPNTPAAAPADSPLPAAPPPAATPPAAPAAPPAATAPGAAPDSGAIDDSSAGQSLEMVGHAAAYIEGKTNWNEGFAALMAAHAQIKAELAKAGLAPSGRPITVFTETDDNGFSYRAMVPIDKSPEGKTALSDTVKLGQTPAGKAMKFEHRGSYEDIDSTYEAITAYLDEKGLEAANLFVEEYLNEVKTPDDPNLQVDIYVLLK
jgi:effector-binding domain-containing protein